jgi:hypothetical protein
MMYKPTARVYPVKKRIRAAGDRDEGNPIMDHTVRYPVLATHTSGLRISTISPPMLTYGSAMQRMPW